MGFSYLDDLRLVSLVVQHVDAGKTWSSLIQAINSLSPPITPHTAGSPFNPNDGGVIWRICQVHCGGRLPALGRRVELP